jgi:hypothetical protein
MFSLGEGLVASLNEETKRKFPLLAGFKFKIDPEIVYSFLLSISKSLEQ